MIRIHIPGTVTKFYLDIDKHINLCEALKICYPCAELVLDCILTETDFCLFVYEYHCVIRNYTKVLEIFHFTSESQLLSKIARLIQYNIVCESDIIVLHAMATKYQNKIIAFLAESGVGKTTLSTYLAQDPAWTILSEDMLIVNYYTRRITLYPRPFLLRENSLDVLHKCGISIHPPYNNLLKRYVQPQRAYNVTQPLVLSHLAFLTRRTGVLLPSIEQVRGDSVLDILANCFCPFQMKNNVVGANYLNKNCYKLSITYDRLPYLKSELQTELV